jgi:hypothetical protein
MSAAASSRATRSTVEDTVGAAALATLAAAIDRVVAAGLTPGDSVEAAAMMAELEAITRASSAASIDLLDAVEQAGLRYLDGHVSAKVMMRHLNRQSGGEATGRDRCRRMFTRLHLVADAYRAGTVGTDQVMLLARVFANPRVATRWSTARTGS